MTTEIEEPDMGGWQENLIHWSTREKEVANSSDWYSK